MTTYTREQLNKKNELELSAICASELGFSMDPDSNSKKTMIDTILDAFEDRATKTAAAATDKVEADPKPAAGAKAARYRLVIHNQEGVDNTPFVPIGVNGFVYQIPREVEVAVPQEVIDTLNQAVITRYEPAEDGKSLVPREARRFPYTVLGVAA